MRVCYIIKALEIKQLDLFEYLLEINENIYLSYEFWNHHEISDSHIITKYCYIVATDGIVYDHYYGTDMKYVDKVIKIINERFV